MMILIRINADEAGVNCDLSAECEPALCTDEHLEALPTAKEKMEHKTAAEVIQAILDNAGPAAKLKVDHED